MKFISKILHLYYFVVCLLVPSYFLRADSPNIIVETLMETEKSWDGVLYKEYPTGTPQLSILKYTIPPNTVLSWHEHSVPNAGYVLKGKLTVEKRENGEKRLLKTGDVLSEMVDGVHRSFTGKEGATLIVFYAGKKGIPLLKKTEE